MSPLVTVKEGNEITDGRSVANLFGRRHDNVLRDADNLLKSGANPKLGGWLKEVKGRDQHGRISRATKMEFLHPKSASALSVLPCLVLLKGSREQYSACRAEEI